MEFDGKRCLITGAASGIGAATARLFAQRGASIISFDRNPPTVAIDQHVPVDLTDLPSIANALDQVDGQVDIVCNVAGLPGTRPAADVFAVNFLAARHIAESFFDKLPNGGAIVNVASTAGFGWQARMPQILDLLGAGGFDEGAQWFNENPQAGNAYNFSKEALTVYTMAKAPGLMKIGVRMNAVSPGPVETPILVDFEESMGKEIIEGLKELTGRHAEPVDIARVIAFLASAEASWVNGHNVIVDGGVTGALLTGVMAVPEI